MISVWSGREAHALREAMRMSIDEFAVHLGASRRGVAKWSVRGQSVKLRWDMQRALDDVLAQAPAEVRERLNRLLANESLPTADPLPVGDDRSPLSELLVSPPVALGAGSPALIRLEREVARVRMAYQAGRYRHAIDELPGLTQALAEARADAEVLFPARVRRMAAAVHQTTASLLLKLGDVPLAMLAAEKSVSEAAASEEPLAIAGSARAVARVLLTCGHQDRAVTLALRAAGDLRQATDLEAPRPLSAYGSLLLCAAVAAARDGDRKAAPRLLDAADKVANKLGVQGNFAWTAFGPVNVSLHRMSVLTEFGEARAVVELAPQVDPGGIAQLERRATYHVDLARAYLHVSRPAEAINELHKVYAIAPDELKMRPQNRNLVAELTEAARGPAKDRAARLAEELAKP